MKNNFRYLIIYFMILIWGMSDVLSQQNHNIDSYAQFKHHLNSLAQIGNDADREAAVSEFWNVLAAENKIPFVKDDSVAFLFRGEADSVCWAGDFSGWQPFVEEFTGRRIGESQVWMCETIFPLDARLDYKIIVNDKWLLDPTNPFQQWSGFGPNSELRMPAWKFPEEAIFNPQSEPGRLSEVKLIHSQQLGYAINYRVYTPAGYDTLSNLASIYVTDGHEYANEKLGSMETVLNNLIAQNRIQPIIAVFVDPRDPENRGNNRRASEYQMNPKFSAFVAHELVTEIDKTFRTDPSSEQRGILGTSLGGINSAYFGVIRHDVFQLIAIQSPAFQFTPAIYQLYQETDRLPLKIFMSTGVIHDTQEPARQMKHIFDEKGYPLKYIEVNEGHSWGQWRALLDEMLVYFFE